MSAPKQDKQEQKVEKKRAENKITENKKRDHKKAEDKRTEKKKKQDRLINIAAIAIGIILLILVVAEIFHIRLFTFSGNRRSNDDNTESSVVLPEWIHEEELIVMGEYPQSEVAGSALTDEIINAPYDENGDAIINGTRYHRTAREDITYPVNEGTEGYQVWEDGVEYRYFIYEPLCWRVLDDHDGRMLLLSELIIDCRYYHETPESVTWEMSDMYHWLNGYFLETAFSPEEKERIEISDWGKVFLLDTDQLDDCILMTPEFQIEDIRGYSTPYARSMGAYIGVSEGDAWWYLRYDENAEFTLRTGSRSDVSVSSIMAHGKNTGTGVRPAILISY